MADVDLADLTRGYDFRPMSDAARERVQKSSAGLRGPALDIGGGVGEHAEVMTSVGLIPVVVDAAHSMCLRAVQNGVRTVAARSQALPFADDSVVLAYFHLSIHYGSWRAAISEAVRVVAPGGRIEIWTFDRTGIEGSSLARWFPSVLAIDTARFPDPDEMASVLEAACAQVSVGRVSEGVEREVGKWREAVRHRFVSTLQLIDEAELAAGIERFSTAFPDDNAIYPYELDFVRISAVVH